MKVDNELIAEFMGFDRVELYTDIDGNDHHFYKYPFEKGTPYPWFKPYRSEQMEFHTSWDWLMPVVEKIMDTELPNGKYANYVEFSITNHDNIGWIFWNKNIPGDQNQQQSYPMGGTRISRVYRSVVEFIKWHNQQSK